MKKTTPPPAPPVSIPGARRADEVDIELGERLWKMRLERAITRREAAEVLGVTAQQVQKYELGQDRLSIGRLVKLAALLKVEVATLVNGLGGAEPVEHDFLREAVLLEGFRKLRAPEMREAVLDMVAKLGAVAVEAPVPAPRVRPTLRQRRVAA